MASALPGHLFQTYASYKVGTREVIQWLCQNTDHSFNSYHVNSIWRLEHLSDFAVQEHVQVSPKILRTLRRTIKARNKVGAYFMMMSGVEQQEASSTHSHFTSVLIGIYHRLSVDVGCVRAPPSPEQKAPLEFSNMFGGLDYDESDEYSTSTVDVDEHPMNASRNMLPRERTNAGSDKNHDVIGEFMALSMSLSVCITRIE